MSGRGDNNRKRSGSRRNQSGKRRKHGQVQAEETSKDETIRRLKEQVAQQTKDLEKERKKNDKIQKKSDQQTKDLEKERKLTGGTYFALIDDVFKCEQNFINVETQAAAITALKRVCRSDVQVKKISEKPFKNGKTESKAYGVTFAKADTSSPGNAATDKTQERTTTHSLNKAAIWKKGIFGEKPDGDIAHIVPASSNHADTYWFVTHFLFGYDEERPWDHMQRLIHGTTQASGSRFPNTGIKHSVTNKILLHGQGEHLDQNPHVLIIPIFTLQGAKKWAGEGYEAIILIDGPTNDRQNLSSITSSLHYHLGETNRVANKREVEMAYKLAKDYMRAIIGAQLHLVPDSSKLEWEDFGKLAGAAFPDIQLAWKKTHKVRKIQFASHKQEDEGHTAPDPILLATRAAIQLQKRHKINLVAAAEPQDEDDDNDSAYKSALAEEEFLWKRRLWQQFELEKRFRAGDFAIEMGNIGVEMGGVDSDIEMEW